jgi:hypothetical protein
VKIRNPLHFPPLLYLLIILFPVASHTAEDLPPVPGYAQARTEGVKGKHDNIPGMTANTGIYGIGDVCHRTGSTGIFRQPCIIQIQPALASINTDIFQNRPEHSRSFVSRSICMPYRS